MDWILSAWAGVTEGQAIIISALLTIIAAVIGVLLGARLFGGKVKDLGSALETSKLMVEEHNTQVSGSFREIRTRLEGLESLFASATESLGQLRGTVGDISASSGVQAGEAAEPVGQVGQRDQVRSDWEAIRDRLEQIAATPSIDGRTRARYARIDRRSYSTLIDALENDGRLGRHGQHFHDAVQLWHQFRSGRRQPTAQDIASMQDIRRTIVPAQ